MSKILIKTHFDYADEFDVEGFVIYDSIDEYEIQLKKLENILDNDYFEIPFGTNESIEIEGITEYERGVEILEISDDEAAVINKILGTRFGIPILPGKFVE